jgi:hypothetical protein
MKIPCMTEVFVNESRMDLVSRARGLLRKITSLSPMSFSRSASSVLERSDYISVGINVGNTIPDEKDFANCIIYFDFYKDYTATKGGFSVHKKLPEWAILLSIEDANVFERAKELDSKLMKTYYLIEQGLKALQENQDVRSTFVHEMTHAIEHFMREPKKRSGPAASKYIKRASLAHDDFEAVPKIFNKSSDVDRLQGQYKKEYNKYFQKYANIDSERSARVSQIVSDFIDEITSSKDFSSLSSFPIFWNKVNELIRKKESKYNIHKDSGGVFGLNHKEMKWFQRAMSHVWQDLKDRYLT